jgi:hypothetical protein
MKSEFDLSPSSPPFLIFIDGNLLLSYIVTACTTIKHIARAFSGVIIGSLTANHTTGIDFAREER